MRSHMEGFVLLTTFLMLSLLALLVVANMKSVSLYFKMSNHLISSHQDFYRLEAVVNEIGISHLHDCVSSEQDPNRLLEQLRQVQGCDLALFHHTYHYIVSDLGISPCLQINLNSSHHWLISVIDVVLQSHSLQVRVALPEKQGICLEEKSRLITGGIVSWRHLRS